MTDQELLDSDILDTKATEWINRVGPEIYKKLEEAQIHYDEEMICHLLADGFKIGYATCFRELRGQESPQ